MTEEAMESCQESGETHPCNLRKVAEILRNRFSSVRVETSVADSDTALRVRFVGDVANLAERQMLVSSLAECLPPALSILGVRPEQEHCDQEAVGSNNVT
jgi:hypothetical protein